MNDETNTDTTAPDGDPRDIGPTRDDLMQAVFNEDTPHPAHLARDLAAELDVLRVCCGVDADIEVERVLCALQRRAELLADVLDALDIRPSAFRAGGAS